MNKHQAHRNLCSRYPMARNLALSGIFSCSVAAQTDPTAVDKEMEDVIEALRKAEDQQPEKKPAKKKEESFMFSLVGVVHGSRTNTADNSGVAVIEVDKRLALIREGETLSHKGVNYIGDTVNGNKVVLRSLDGKGNLVLRSLNPAFGDPFTGNVETYDMLSVPLYLAAQALSIETGIKIVVSAKARDTPISINLEKVNDTDIIEAITLTHGLFKAKVPNTDIIRIHTSEEYSRDANSFLEEKTQVFKLSHPNARDVAVAISDLYGDRVKLSGSIDGGGQPGQAISDDLEQRFNRFDVMDGRGMGLGLGSSGGGGGGSSSSNNSNRSNNSSNSRASSALLPRRNQSGGRGAAGSVDRIELGKNLTQEDISALQSGNMQKLKEIIESRADIFISVVDQQNQVIVRTRDEKTMKEISQLIKTLDVATPLVLIEVKVLEVALDNGRETAFDWNFKDGNWGGSFLPSSPNVAGDFVFSFLSNSFQSQLKLLQRTNKLTVLGRPLLMTANKEVSRLFIGEEVPLNRSFEGGQTIVSDGSPIVTPGSTDIEFRPVGSTLLITPTINDEKTVSIRLLQEESRLKPSGAEVLVPDGNSGFAKRSIDVVASQTASGTFVARDRQTIAVGGMITERLQKLKSQIPVLGDIPVLGALARNETEVKKRTEIVILLTPHIISHPDRGEEVTRKVLKDTSFYKDAVGPKGGLRTYSPDDILRTKDMNKGLINKLKESTKYNQAPKSNSSAKPQKRIYSPSMRRPGK